MQLTCPINQAEAIRRGFDADSTVKLEIDPAPLSQAQRDLLATRFKEGKYEAYGDDRLPEPTIAGLIESLDKRICEIKADAEKKEQEKQRLLARFDADPCEIVYYYSYNDQAGFRDNFQSTWIEGPRKTVFDATMAKLRAEYQEKEAAKKAKEESDADLRKAREAERQANKESFRQWALTHGSETVRLRAEEVMNWESLAAEEWATAMLTQVGITDTPLTDPIGYDHSLEDAAEPTAAEIQNLRRIRQALATLPETEAAVTLHDVLYTEEIEDEYNMGQEPDVIKRVEIRVHLTTPTGGGVTRYFQA